jgi:hypothetical protein
MFEFIFGVGFGVWIGTLHDFAPYIEIIKMKLSIMQQQITEAQKYKQTKIQIPLPKEEKSE